jgi:iron complex outermembrane receptor protein
MLRVWLGASSLIAVGGAVAAVAQEEAEPERIVVTGTAVETASGETLQSVEVLSLEEVIEAFDGSLGASLATLPGISTSSFGPAVGRPIIRGLGGYRVRILNNGVGLVDASSLSADHAATAEVLDAEQIDILRGPAAIAYGGGAIGGVINIVDGRIATRPLDGPVDGQAYAGASSVDEGWQVAGRGRFGAGPLILQLEGSHREAGDIDIPGFAESARQRAMEEEEEGEADEVHEEAFGTVPNSGFAFDTVGGGASVIGEWGFFGVSVRDYDAVYGLPGHEHEEEEEGGIEAAALAALAFEGVAHIEMEQTRTDVRGELAFPVGPFDHIDLSGGVVDYEHAEIEDTGEVGTVFENDGWEARAALVNGERGDVWSGSVGAAAMQTDFSATGEEAFVPPVETTDWGVFAAQRYDRGGWGLEGGLRFETRELEPSAAASRSFDTVSAAVGGFLRPADGVFLTASVTRTERAPVDQELFSNGPHAATETFEIGDPNLDKETGLSLDLGARLRRDRWRIEAGGFVSQFSDFIYLAPTDEEMEGLAVFRFLQEDASLWGGELSVERDIAELGPWTLVGDGSLEYVRGETDTLGDLPQMPPFSATLGLGLERNLVALHGEVEHVAAQDDVAAFELPTDGYTFVHLSASARPFGGAARLVLEVRNATDEEGRLHTSQLKDVIPLPGRSIRVGVLTRF